MLHAAGTSQGLARLPPIDNKCAALTGDVAGPLCTPDSAREFELVLQLAESRSPGAACTRSSDSEVLPVKEQRAEQLPQVDKTAC